MRGFFHILTIAAVAIMILTILLQAQGSGLSTTFGGSGDSYRSKRGAEKIIYNMTIVTAIIFVLSVILGILSKS